MSAAFRAVPARPGAPRGAPTTHPQGAPPGRTASKAARARSAHIWDLCRRQSGPCLGTTGTRTGPLTAPLGARDRPPRSGPDRLPQPPPHPLGCSAGTTGLQRLPGPAALIYGSCVGGRYRVRQTPHPGPSRPSDGAGSPRRPHKAHIWRPCRTPSGRCPASDGGDRRILGWPGRHWCIPHRHRRWDAIATCTGQLWTAPAAPRTPMQPYTRPVSAEIPPTSAGATTGSPVDCDPTLRRRGNGRHLLHRPPRSTHIPDSLRRTSAQVGRVPAARRGTPSVRWRSRRRHADSDHLHPAAWDTQ